MKNQDDCFSITSAPVNGEALRPEINLHETKTGDVVDCQQINVGYVPVIISKLFGPLIFADLRITAKSDTCEWVIERQCIKTNKWIEMERIPGQFPEEFKED